MELMTIARDSRLNEAKTASVDRQSLWTARPSRGQPSRHLDFSLYQ